MSQEARKNAFVEYMNSTWLMGSSTQEVTFMTYIRELPDTDLGQEAIIMTMFSVVFISHYTWMPGMCPKLCYDLFFPHQFIIHESPLSFDTV
jgi:hypothetical protein